MNSKELAKKREEKLLQQKRLKELEDLANENLSPEQKKARLEELGIKDYEIIDDEDIKDEDLKRDLKTTLLSMIPFTNAYYEAAAAENEMDDLIKILKEKNRAEELFAQTKENGRELEALDELMVDTNYDFFYFNKLKTTMIEKGKYSEEEAHKRINTFDTNKSESNRLKLAINKTFYMTKSIPTLYNENNPSPIVFAADSLDSIPVCSWKGRDSYGNNLKCSNFCRERGKGEAQKLLNVSMTGSGYYTYCSFHIPCCINPIHEREGVDSIDGLTQEDRGKVRIKNPNRDSLCSECFMLFNKFKAPASSLISVPGVIIEKKEIKKKKDEDLSKRERQKKNSFRHSFSSLRGSFSIDVSSSSVKSSTIGAGDTDIDSRSRPTTPSSSFSPSKPLIYGKKDKTGKDKELSVSLLAKKEAGMNQMVTYTEETLKYPYNKTIKKKRRFKCFWKPTSLSELDYECNNKCMTHPTTGELLIFCPYHIPFCLLTHPEGQSNEIKCPNNYALCNLHYITIRGEAPKEKVFPYPGMKKKDIKDRNKETYEEFISRHFAVPKVPPPPVIYQSVYSPPIPPSTNEEKIADQKIRKEREKLLQLLGNKSAITIQKRMRGFLHREYLVKPIKQLYARQLRHKAAILIQTHVRRYQAALFFWEKFRVETLAAIKIQSFLRGSLLRASLLRTKSAIKLQRFMKKLHMFKFKDQVIKVMEIKRMYFRKNETAVVIQKYFRRYRAIKFVHSKKLWNLLSNISSRKIQKAFRNYLILKKKKFLASSKEIINIRKKRKVALYLARRITDLYISWRDHKEWWARVGDMAPIAQRMIRGLLGRTAVQKIKFARQALKSWLNITEGVEYINSLLFAPRSLEYEVSNDTKFASMSFGITQTLLCNENSSLLLKDKENSISNIFNDDVGPISQFLPHKFQKSIEVKLKYFSYALELYYDKVVKEPLLTSERNQIIQAFTSPLTGNIYVKALEAYAVQCTEPCQQHGRQICVTCIFRGKCQVPDCECESFEINGKVMSDEERGMKKKLKERQLMINSLFNLSDPEDVEILKIITEEENIKKEAENGKVSVPKNNIKKSNNFNKNKKLKSTICSCCSHDRFSHLMHPLSSRKKILKLLPDKYSVEKHYFQTKYKEILPLLDKDKTPDISLPATIQGIKIEDALIRPLTEDDMRDYMENLNKEKTRKNIEEIETLDKKNDIVKLLALNYVDGRIIKDHPVYWEEEKKINKKQKLSSNNTSSSNGDMTELKEIITFSTLNEDKKYKNLSLEDLFSNPNYLKNHSREEYDAKFNNSLPITIVRNGELVYTHQHDELYFNILIDLIRIYEKGEEEYKQWLESMKDEKDENKLNRKDRPKVGINEDNEELLLLIMNNIQIFERHWRKMIVDLRNGNLNNSLKINTRKDINKKFLQTNTERSFLKTKKNNNKEISLFGPLPDKNNEENEEGISLENEKIYNETNYPRPDLASKLEKVLLKLKFNLKSFGKDIKMQEFAKKKENLDVDLMKLTTATINKNEINLKAFSNDSLQPDFSNLQNEKTNDDLPMSSKILLNDDQIKSYKDKKRRNSMPLNSSGNSQTSIVYLPSPSSSPVELDMTLQNSSLTLPKLSLIKDLKKSTQLENNKDSDEIEKEKKANRRLLLKKLAKTFDDNKDLVEDLRIIGKDTETEAEKNLRIVAPSLDTVAITGKLSRSIPSNSNLKKRRGSHGDILGIFNQVEIGDSFYQSTTLPRNIQNDLKSVIASATGDIIETSTSGISSTAFIPINLQGSDKEKYLDLTGQVEYKKTGKDNFSEENYSLDKSHIIKAKNRFICPFPACGQSFLSEITCRQHILTDHENHARLTSATPSSDYFLHYFWPKDAPWLSNNLSSTTSLKKTIPPGSCQCKYLKCGEIFSNKVQEEAHYKLVHGKISLASIKMNYIELFGSSSNPSAPIFTISPDPIPGPGFGLLFCRSHQVIVGSCLKCVEIESELYKARVKQGSWRPSLSIEKEYRKKLKKDKELYEEGLPKPPYNLYSKISIDLNLLNETFPFPTHLLEASTVASSFTFSPVLSPTFNSNNQSSAFPTLPNSPNPKSILSVKNSAKPTPLAANGVINFSAKYFNKKITISQSDNHLVLQFYSPKSDPLLKAKFIKGRVLYHLVDSEKTVWFGIEPLLLSEEIFSLGYTLPSYVPPEQLINKNSTGSLYNIESVKSKNRFNTLMTPSIKENNMYQLYPLRLFECPSLTSAFGEITHKLNPSVIRWFPSHSIVKAYRLHYYVIPDDKSLKLEEPPERTFYTCYNT